MGRATRKLDSRLLNVQKLIAKATALRLMPSDKLHSLTFALADPWTTDLKISAWARLEERNLRFVVAASETLDANGGIIAVLCTAQLK